MSELGALVGRHLGAFNARDVDAWLRLLDDDVVIGSEYGILRGLDAARGFAEGLVHRLGGIRAELDRVVLERGDTIVFEYGLVPTDPEPDTWNLEGRVCQVLRVHDGRIAEMRSYYASGGSDIPAAPSRADAVRIAAEQTALRRVATLVARGISQEELFAAVNEEIGRLVEADFTALLRFEDDDTVTLVAAWAHGGGRFPLGARRPADSLLRELRDSGRPRRIDGDDLAEARSFPDLAERFGVRVAVGVPVEVEGGVWGASFAIAADPEAFPAGTEDRIARFAELVATALANAQAREQLHRVAAEQRALREVAMLVARDASEAEVFDAVVAQASQVLGEPAMTLLRYEPDGTGTVVATRYSRVAPGAIIAAEGDGVAARVRRTRRPARVDDYAALRGLPAAMASELGVRGAVAAPVLVGGRLWGALTALSFDAPLPRATEERLAQFGELIATAIDNAESRAALAASRARVVAAADESRHRIQRDLQEGPQRRLADTTVTLRRAADSIGDAGEPVAGLVRESLENAEGATAQLRELAQGILPGALDHGGLRAGVESVVRSMDLPVRVDVASGRLPQPVEKTAYFVIAEALTNAVKHACATSASVRAVVDAAALRVEIRDDGVGGADATSGTGLLGLGDRVAASGGRLTISSPPGVGTTLVVTLPLGAQAPR